MTRLAQRVAVLEYAGVAADLPCLLLVLRTDRLEDDLVAVGDFPRMPGESVDALKARIELAY
jgi:hypothetical protein